MTGSTDEQRETWPSGVPHPAQKTLDLWRETYGPNAAAAMVLAWVDGHAAALEGAERETWTDRHGMTRERLTLPWREAQP